MVKKPSFFDRVARGHGAPFLLQRGVDVDALPRGLSAACLCPGRLLCPDGSGSLLCCLGHGVRDVVVFVLADGSSDVVVLVARATIAVVVAIVIVVVVFVVVCNLETGKGGSVRYIKKNIESIIKTQYLFHICGHR